MVRISNVSMCNHFVFKYPWVFAYTLVLSSAFAFHYITKGTWSICSRRSSFLSSVSFFLPSYWQYNLFLFSLSLSLAVSLFAADTHTRSFWRKVYFLISFFAFLPSPFICIVLQVKGNFTCFLRFFFRPQHRSPPAAANKKQLSDNCLWINWLSRIINTSQERKKIKSSETLLSPAIQEIMSPSGDSSRAIDR